MNRQQTLHGWSTFKGQGSVGTTALFVSELLGFHGGRRWLFGSRSRYRAIPSMALREIVALIRFHSFRSQYEAYRYLRINFAQTPKQLGTFHFRYSIVIFYP